MHLLPAGAVHSDRVEGGRNGHHGSALDHIGEVLQSALADGLVGCTGKVGGRDVYETVGTVDLTECGDEFHGLLSSGALLSVEDRLLVLGQIHGWPIYYGN